MDIHQSLAEELSPLISAEDFLDFFAVAYDQKVVEVKRLHILQRFHDYVRRHTDDMPTSAAEQHTWLRQWLVQAYENFVVSDALTEKVFRVFRDSPRAEGGTSTFTPIEEIFK